MVSESGGYVTGTETTRGDRVLACSELRPEVTAQLQRLRDRLDPFALAHTIEQQLERIYALATSRPSAPPTPAASAATVPRRVRKRFSIKPSPHLAARPSRPVTSETAR
jgi:phage portal protein BeeE